MAHPWPPHMNPRADYQDSETTLSQHRNLYFVGSAHVIYVYRPQGPNIGAKPKLILEPDLARPDARGHVSPHGPHNLNRLMTGDLGEDEILLFATDSGNIGAYSVATIASTIEEIEAIEDEICDPWSAGSRIHCFFTQFTGCSTWGLAIHKYARLIAVSANSHDITVFAFALQQGGSESPNARSQAISEHEDDRGWPYIAEQDELDKLRMMSREERRSVDLRIEYAGHRTNIPSVSFLNSDLDRHADFMVSLDIDNMLFIWRIWQSLEPLRVIELGLLSTPKLWDYGVVQGYRGQRGWGVMALDPRSFRTKTLLNFACPGGQQPSTYCELYEPTSPLYHRVSSQDVETPFPPEVDDILGRVSKGHPKPPDPKIEKLWQIPLDFPEPFLGTNLPMDYQEGVENAGGASIQPEQELSDADDDNDGDGNGPDGGFVDWSKNYRTDETYRNYLAQYSNFHYCPDFIDLPLVMKTPAKVHWENDFNLPNCYINFPIVTFSEQEVKLLRGPFSIQPCTTYDNPSYSQVNGMPAISRNWERFNLYEQIPELGLVIAASQRGRVCIFTMTDVPAEGPSLRLDHVLPRRTERVYGPLLGIATGPVASQLDCPDNERVNVPGEAIKNNWENIRHPYRRYRLLIYYMDQTILHYDLSYKWPEDMSGVKNDSQPDTSRWLLVRQLSSSGGRG
ncbi:hypothetical protein KEM54_003937 [Ascosphaera aggregata]|nr:hypothetical protein KEM54_003937 [Ascosphaera aggregata]